MAAENVRPWLRAVRDVIRHGASAFSLWPRPIRYSFQVGVSPATDPMRQAWEDVGSDMWSGYLRALSELTPHERARLERRAAAHRAGSERTAFSAGN